MFSKHLAQSNTTYIEHFKFAFYAGLMLIWAGITSIIHAFIPSLFPFVSRKITVDLIEQSRRLAMRSKQSDMKSS
jgi:hypothetical protein